MYHEIQAEDKTNSKKSVSSTIKSRPRVKSMSNLHPLFTPYPSFIASKKWVICVNWSCLNILFTLDLLFIVLEADFLLEVSSSTWISWYIFLQFFRQLTTKCHEDWGGDQVQHNPEHHATQLHVEEGEEQVKLNPEHHDGHLQGGEVENQFPHFPLNSM